jgi:hypothetical protein
LVCLVFTSTVYQTNAGVGFCAKYLVSVESINGQEQSGIVFLLNYEEPWDSSQELKFKDYLLGSNPYDTVIRLYQHVEKISLVAHSNDTTKVQFDTDAVSSGSILSIAKGDVEAVKVMKTFPCSLDEYGRNTGFYWNGIYPVIISELTVEELSLLNSDHKKAFHFRGNNPFYPVEYWVVCDAWSEYREKVDSQMNVFLNQTEQAIKNGSWASVPSLYSELKRNFRKNGLVLLKLELAI